MVRSMKGIRAGEIQRSDNRAGWMEIGIYKVFFVILLCLLTPVLVRAQEKGKVAVLPFEIHSPEPIDYLKEGLQTMLTSRMAEKGYDLISTAVVNKHPMAFLPAFETKDIVALGKDLDADWVILGSLTQIGIRVSLDLKVVDVSMVKSPFSVFMVEDDVDRVADAVERAAVSIDNQISGVTQIESIQVTGNRRIESDAILAVIESRKGERFDQDKLDDDLRAIFRMGYFKDVSIESEDGAKGKVVTFKVVEKPSIGQISFDGNKKIKDKELEEEIGIKKYSILNQSEVKQSVNRLREHYRLKGYYNVEITDEIQDLPNNEVSLLYHINEGEKVYIRKIEFVGNTIFDDDDLKDVMETSEKGFLSWFTKSGMLDMKKLEFDIQKVVSFYHNRGYIKAKAGEPQVAYDEGVKGLKITIEIIEGNQYKVNKVSLEGDLIRPEEELQAALKINKEKFFNREAIRQDILMLKDLYADDGFAYAEVVPITKEDDKNYLVDITYEISKKKRVRFERINITGNSMTRDKVIRRELKVVEDDYFSGTNLRKSTANLHRLGFFEDIEVNTREGSQDDLMILDIGVKERRTDTFSVGAGYSSFDKVIGMTQVSFNNLGGRAQRLVGQAALGSRTTQFSVSFTEPWLLDKPLSAGVDLYKWVTEYDTYTKDSLGGALRFGFPLNIDEYTRGSIRYAYDDADITDVLDTAATVIKDMAGTNVTSSITLGVERDSKDRPWDTRKGSVNSLSVEYAGGIFGGNSYFTKYMAKSQWYFPMWWDTVFMIEGRAGYAKERSGGRLPIYEKFVLGGIDSVRGYEYATISPRDPATGDVIGGEKMWVYKLEYIFPVLKEQGLRGLVFFDAGNVFRKEEDFEFKARSSVGTGVRWYSPIGPLRLEYGWKLDKRTGETGGTWEFSIGGQF